MRFYIAILLISLFLPGYLIYESNTFFEESLYAEKDLDSKHLISAHFAEYAKRNEDVPSDIFHLVQEKHDPRLYSVEMRFNGMHTVGIHEVISSDHKILKVTGEYEGINFDIYYDIQQQTDAFNEIVVKSAIIAFIAMLIPSFLMLLGDKSKHRMQLLTKKQAWLFLALYPITVHSTIHFNLFQIGYNLIEPYQYMELGNILLGSILFFLFFLTLTSGNCRRAYRETRQLEEALELKNMDIEAILNSTTEGICGCDLDGKTTFSNIRFSEILGSTAPTDLGLKQGTSKILTNDTYATYTCSPILDNGIQRGWVLVVVDKTKERNAEANLETSKLMLKTVLDTIPISVFWKGLDGKFAGFNQHFSREMRTSNIIGRTSLDFLPEKVAHRVMHSDLEVIRTGESKMGLEEWISFEDRTEIHEISKVPLLGLDNEIIGVLGVSRDVTKQKETEQFLIVAQKQLEGTVVQLGKKHEVLTAIKALQQEFILQSNPIPAFQRLIALLVKATDSSMGVIAEVIEGDTTFLRTYVTEGINIEGQNPPIDFFHFDNLLGAVVTTGKPIIANDALTDPRKTSRPLPSGHPKIQTFLGIPLIINSKVIGLIGLANREEGYTDQNVEDIQSVSETCSYILTAHKSEEMRLRAETSLVESEELFRTITQSTHDAIVILDEDGRITFWSNGARDIFGYEKRDILGQSYKVLLPYRYWGEDRRPGGPGKDSDILVISDHDIEVTILRRDKTEVPVEVTFNSILESDSYMIVVRDISDRKKQEQKLYRIAYYDKLTGIPNRRLMEEILEQGIEQAKQTGKKVGVLFIDLDKFKQVNDTLGHEAGDELLREVAKRILAVIRKSDSVIRLGGDEFLSVLNNTEVDPCEKTSERILAQISSPFTLSGQSVTISGSIGIAYYPEHGTEATDLLKKSDIAMYKAKGQGRNNIQTYTHEYGNENTQNMLLEAKIRHMAFEEFHLVYQPQTDLKGNTIGVEALIRWTTEDFDADPELIIKVAEDTGRIVDLGYWILDRAIKDVQKNGIPYRLCVNVSVIQVQQPDFHSCVQDILAKNGFDPTYLELEVTETTLIENIGSFTDTLKELAKLGVGLAIDDFGTGYSSFNYLKHISDIRTTGRVKLDKSFMDLSEESNQKLVQKMIGISHDLGLKVVAEGVERVEDLEFLKENNCDFIQGYLTGRPAHLKDLKT